MSDLVVIARFRSRVEAELARSVLTDAGVDALLQADDAGGMYAGIDLSSGGARLLVREDDADLALEALEAIEGGDADSDADPDPDADSDSDSDSDSETAEL